MIEESLIGKIDGLCLFTLYFAPSVIVVLIFIVWMMYKDHRYQIDRIHRLSERLEALSKFEYAERKKELLKKYQSLEHDERTN